MPIKSATASVEGVELRFDEGDPIDQLYQSWVDHEEWLFRDRGEPEESLSLE